MGRSESKQAFQQSSAQSSQDQANSQAALAKTNVATDSFNNNLKNFMRFGRKTYGADGDYMKTNNALATTVAAGGAKGLEGDLALNAARTGDNTANYAATDAESRRQQQRDLTTFLAQANQNRLGQLTDIEKTGLDQSKFPATVQSSLYGTGAGAANAAEGNATSAAKTPGFWDTFLPALAQGAGAAIGGACPCAGTMIRMADGLDKPVEELREGDFVMSLSSCVPPNRVMLTPKPIIQPCTAITTDKGKKHRASDSHTLMLAVGGYGHMPELKDHTVMAEFGGELVTEVVSIGEELVYPIELNGNHTYLADGLWVLS